MGRLVNKIIDVGRWPPEVLQWKRGGKCGPDPSGVLEFRFLCEYQGELWTDLEEESHTL